MTNGRFRTFRQDGTEVKKGDILVTKNESWIYQSTTHPRKIYVTWKNDPNGDDHYPNMISQEFFANVFNLGIWDTERKEWSFAPNTPFTPTT